MPLRQPRAVLLAATISLLPAGCKVVAERSAAEGGTPSVAGPNDGASADDGGDDAAAPTAPNVIAQVNGLISAVAMDDTTIYFAWKGTVSSVPKDGSAPPRQVATLATQFVEGIAVDGTDVYATDLADGTIERVPKGGGVAETIATGQLRPCGIVVDDERVYWANKGTDSVGAPGNDGSIMALAKSGGSPVVLAQGEQMPGPITLSAGTLVWADGPWGGANGMLRSLTPGLDAGAPTALASGLDNTWVPVVAGGNAYITVDGDLGSSGAIEGFSLTGDAGSEANPVVASFASEGPLAIAADASFLYYGAIGSQAGAVYEIPLGGGAATEVAPSPRLPADLLVGETPQFLLVDGTRIFVFDYYALETTGEQGVVRAYAK
jgi:hypothetical protein